LQPRVLFISKPVSPPFHDGTKCLVRDVASHLERVSPIVLTAKGAPNELPVRVQRVEVYGSSGAFTPRFSDNLRAAAWVLLRSNAELWHFVFAPNPRTSAVGKALKLARRARVVQTVASPPRSFEGIHALLFGDGIVAQSRSTRDRIEAAYREAGASVPRLEVIPPPVPDLAPRDPEAVSALQRELGLDPAQPLFVYPGDLETSRGAETVAAIAEELTQALPQATVVFAYREKTSRAPQIAARLEQRLAGKRVRFVREMPDVLVLVAAATAILFPVDELHGKVDLPIVLLEAMTLGVPVVALDLGPLADLRGALRLPSLDVASWTAQALELAREPGARSAAIDAGRAAVDEHYRAQRVAAAYEELYLDLARVRR
jgi:glycosyltransferase involved in cell wall biosynthesis